MAMSTTAAAVTPRDVAAHTSAPGTRYRRGRHHRLMRQVAPHVGRQFRRGGIAALRLLLERLERDPFQFTFSARISDRESVERFRAISPYRSAPPSPRRRGIFEDHLQRIEHEAPRIRSRSNGESLVSSS
jgi:hypothetical protein